MDSYKKAAAVGGTLGGGGTIGCIALGPAGAVVAAGVGIGAGIGCVAKLIFD